MNPTSAAGLPQDVRGEVVTVAAEGTSRNKNIAHLVNRTGPAGKCGRVGKASFAPKFIDGGYLPTRVSMTPYIDVHHC